MRLIALWVLIAGCTPEVAAQPAAPARPTVRPPAAPGGPGPRLPAHTPPTGAIHIRCTVRADIEARVTTSSVRAKVVLRNLGAQEATVTLRETCPGGPVTLAGLPAGFDPMHTCRMGPCAGPSSTKTYRIPARGRVELARTTLLARGDACNPALPLGSTLLRAEIVTEPRQLEVCSGAPLHVVRDHRSRRLRRARLTAPLVPEVLPARPRPSVKAPPARTRVAPKSCPACGFGCTGATMPSSRRDENGCPVCGCDPIGL